MRTYNVEKVKAAVAQYAADVVGFVPEEWLANPTNFAFTNTNDDVALFENQTSMANTVCGHYFFFSRGKQAIEAGKEFLKEIFTTTNTQTIVGLTPVEHKAALWMNRKLGFVENGEVTTEIGPCKFVMLTKQQWKENNK